MKHRCRFDKGRLRSTLRKWRHLPSSALTLMLRRSVCSTVVRDDRALKQPQVLAAEEEEQVGG